MEQILTNRKLGINSTELSLSCNYKQIYKFKTNHKANYIQIGNIHLLS